MMNIRVIVTTAVCLLLVACSQETKKDLGLVNTAPDEFSVVTRAPLSVPPDYTLRPPQPGAARPMEISTSEQARQTIFGENTSRSAQSSSESSNILLNKTGAQAADPNIRNVVDAETAAGAGTSKTTAEKLMFWDGRANSQGTPIDPDEEYERLKEEGVIAVQKRNEEIPAP